MVSRKKKIQIVAAFATLLLFALGLGCNGFFVNPVLTSIAVGPTATINQGATVQESAVGTYNDGSTQTLGAGVQWSSSDSTAATVNSSGLVTGASPGSATITAAYKTTSGTSSITVSLGNVTALKISSSATCSTSAGNTNITASGGTASFYACATVAGDSNPVDVSSAGTTWTLSDTTDFQITQGDPVTITTLTANVGATSTLSATYSSTTVVTAPPVTLTIVAQ